MLTTNVATVTNVAIVVVRMSHVTTVEECHKRISKFVSVTNALNLLSCLTIHLTTVMWRVTMTTHYNTSCSNYLVN